MIVCDRHHRTRAKGKIIVESTDERYDLCDQCLYQIQEYLCSDRDEVEPKTKRKNSAKAA